MERIRMVIQNLRRVFIDVIYVQNFCSMQNSTYKTFGI